MDAVVSIAAVLGILIGTGLLIGLLRPSEFSLRWLLVAAGIVALNDFLLTNGYGLFPQILEGTQWNWQGKILALASSLAIASLPWLGWRRSGLTLVQAPGSLRSCAPLAIAYCMFFLAIALAFPAEDAATETIAFQLTMPSLEEETFYRGILLLALYEAFAGRTKKFGVEWGWGAFLSCALFGLAHAFSYSDGSFAFDPVYMVLTAIPSFLAVWMRLRTGSLLLPVALHSIGNSIGLIV